jgi:hypothetical protein
MKRLFPAVAVLLFLSAAVPVFALDGPANDARGERRDRTTVIDDVIRMSQAGVSDDAIIKFVRASRDSYVVNADVIIALTNAKVSKPVLDAVMDAASMRDDDRGNRRDDERPAATNVYVRPYVGFDPFYPYYAYDPYWYAPRYSVSFGFGRWGGFGGHYYGGGGGRGHNGGGHTGGGHSGGGHGRH